MEEKRFNPGFPQDKAKVLRAVSRVDVHLNDSGTRAGQEKENPLGATAGPYTDAVSGTQALPDQAARRFFDALFQFAIRQPGVSMPHDEGFVRGLARGHLRKRFEDSLLAKRELGPLGSSLAATFLGERWPISTFARQSCQPISPPCREDLPQPAAAQGSSRWLPGLQ